MLDPCNLDRVSSRRCLLSQGSVLANRPPPDSFSSFVLAGTRLCRRKDDVTKFQNLSAFIRSVAASRGEAESYPSLMEKLLLMHSSILASRCRMPLCVKEVLFLHLFLCERKGICFPSVKLSRKRCTISLAKVFMFVPCYVYLRIVQRIPRVS